MKPISKAQMKKAIKHNLSAAEINRVRRYQEYRNNLAKAKAKREYLEKNTASGRIRANLRERLTYKTLSKGFARTGGRVSKRSSNTLISIFTGGRR